MPPARGTRGPATAEPVSVQLPITLGQFLKVANLASSGGEAKILIAQGLVQVNGETDQRRGRKLRRGDIVRVGDAAARVEAGPGASAGSAGSDAPAATHNP
jgi:ribosome-associated protein